LFLQLLEDHAVWIKDLFELSDNFDAPLLCEASGTLEILGNFFIFILGEKPLNLQNCKE